MRPEAPEWIARTAEYARAALGVEGTGHDWLHTERVWRVARWIAEREKVDITVVELAALLHDIGDHKFHGGDETMGRRLAGEWLRQLEVGEDLMAQITAIVGAVSFKGALVAAPEISAEGKVVQDADRLDALGAVGIARTFAYGGARGREIYNPAIPPVLHDSFEAYKNSSAPTINHFYEKLLLLKERMWTPTARVLAEERHGFMEKFLEQFYRELKTGLPEAAL